MIIGQYIEEVFKASKLRPGLVAKELHTTSRNLYTIFKRESIDSEQLFAISKILKHDFFKFYSNRLKQEDPKTFAVEEEKFSKRRVMIEVELDEFEYSELLKKTK